MTDTAADHDQGLPRHPDAERVHQLATLRREFHRHPELSWLEFRTSAEIARQLRELGFEVRTGAELYTREPHNWPPAKQRAEALRQARSAVGGNPGGADALSEYSGVVATLDSDRPGPCFGFRFDIDALPIAEADDDDHEPARAGFASQNPGVMHACGHDGHIAAGLGLARRLSKGLAGDAPAWCGRVHLFFQPAEEVAGGGVYFAELAELQEVDRFATFHIGITGRREVVLDATWLAASILDVTFHGRGAHAGNAPEQGNNALLAACAAIQGLYALPRHSGGSSRLNVGRLRSDNAQNVIADQTRFRFEVRGADNHVRDDLRQRATAVIEGAAAMQGCEAHIEPVSEFIAHPNHDAFVDRLQDCLSRLDLPPAAIRRSYRVPASEDATCMSRAVQDRGGEASHLLIGSPTRGGHHNSRFDFDEDLLAWAEDVFYAMVAGME